MSMIIWNVKDITHFISNKVTTLLSGNGLAGVVGQTAVYRTVQKKSLPW
jgi:predicted MFS family arabinose efflux permease